MIEFISGFLLCWFILGAFGLLGNTLHWEDDDRFWMVISFPILLIAAPLIFVWYTFFYGPWRHVLIPLPEHRWDWVVKRSKVLHIGPNLYICYESKPNYWYEKLYFVRVKWED